MSAPATAVPRRSPTPLRRRGFALLWAGGLVSDLGDWTLLVGLPVFVFQLTGSALTTSTIFVAELVPALVVGQVGGVLVDRLDRQRVLVVASVLQAILLLPLLAVDGPDRLWIVYLVAAAQSGLARVCAPATAALIPRLVPSEELAAANGLSALGASVARLLGAPLGGLAIQLVGLGGVVVADAATFLAAAALVAAIPRGAVSGAADDATTDATADHATAEDPRADDPTADGTDDRRETHHKATTSRRFLRDWVDGWRTIRRDPGIRALVGIGAISQLCQGIFVVLYVVFVIDVLGADGGAVGLIRGMQAVGGIVAGLLVGSIAARIGTRAMIGWGFVAFGLISLATWNAALFTTSVPVYATLFAIAGLPGVAVGVGMLTALQGLTPPSHLGRVFAAYETTSGALQAIGVLAAGALADVIGVRPILNAQALIYVACGIAALWLLREPLARTRPGRSVTLPA